MLRLTIQNINGPGIKVGKGSRSKIKGNQISKCIYGIVSTSNRANIVMNNCFENHESGIKTIAKKNIRCDTRVQFNTCKKNKQHGVNCVGENNFTVVTKNCELSANTCTGVCAQDKASIKITNNLIESNFAQGVLLVESTYAHIEKNILRKNYKA